MSHDHSFEHQDYNTIYDKFELLSLEHQGVVAETKKAFKYQFGTKLNSVCVWLPKAQTRSMHSVVLVPRWLVEARCLEKFSYDPGDFPL